MRVLLATWGSRGDVEPMAGLAVRLRELGVDVQMCAPPDFGELLHRVDIPSVPFGESVRALVAGPNAKGPADAPRVAAALVDEWFGPVAAAAEECDALVVSGLVPAGAPSVAQMHGMHYVCAVFQPGVLPSPDHRPLPRPGPPIPPDVTDNRVLWDIDAERVNALYREPLNTHRAAVGLAPVDNVRDHIFTQRPWLAADPILGPAHETPDFDVVPTGAWILRDTRPLPAELVAFLDAGTPPVYVGFGSMPMHASKDVGRVAVEAIRAQGRRTVVGRGWADLALVDEADDCFAVGEVNHQALFSRVAAVVHHGGAGTTTTAAVAGVPQVVVPQIADQPYWAGRVADLGIGAAHDGPTATFESLSGALETVLASETRARAAAVAGTMRTDGAMVAARLLLDVVTQGRPNVTSELVT